MLPLSNNQTLPVFRWLFHSVTKAISKLNWLLLIKTNIWLKMHNKFHAYLDSFNQACCEKRCHNHQAQTEQKKI